MEQSHELYLNVEIIEPKPSPWPPDDEAFEVKPTTKPLDDPQLSIPLKKHRDKVCVSFCIPALSFLIGDSSSFEFACRGIHHGFPARTWCLSCSTKSAFLYLLYASTTSPSGDQGKKKAFEWVGIGFMSKSTRK